MTATPTPEIESAKSLLWELAEGKLSESDLPALRRIAGLLERQAAEIEALRQAAEGSRAA